jgi:hypothetical protein
MDDCLSVVEDRALHLDCAAAMQYPPQGNAELPFPVSLYAIDRIDVTPIVVK